MLIYKVTTCPTNTVEAICNGYAKEGWQVAAFSQDPHAINITRLLLKRDTITAQELDKILKPVQEAAHEAVCSVCGTTDPDVIDRCFRPDCSDGR